jgi:sulfur carrier protein ThiS
MGLFTKKTANHIRVAVNIRAFMDGRMVRLSLDAQASEGDTIKDLLTQLSREGAVDTPVARSILKGGPGFTVLRNGERLTMPDASGTALRDEDELSILTPMAGG